MSDRLSSHGFATICPWALPATVSHLVFAFSGFAPKKGRRRLPSRQDSRLFRLAFSPSPAHQEQERMISFRIPFPELYEH